jgi:hypothetical protein
MRQRARDVVRARPRLPGVTIPAQAHITLNPTRAPHRRATAVEGISSAIFAHRFCKRPASRPVERRRSATVLPATAMSRVRHGQQNAY